ncbi:MAG TPA: ATP-binding cassette domain-containing protein [Pyrinomonadaceae bacterium]|nr:ATP-binding cassette domain-containing protein [Pyrinomonadaceae bacterium]
MMNSQTADMAQTNAIEFRNVSVSFDEIPVLTDVSFQLGRGEMIFLTGLSGSGKSVLLRLAIGLLKPDSGQIFIEGREIEGLDESDLLAIRGGSMGMVFQEDSLFTGLTVYENAAYRLKELGWTDEQIDKAVSEVLRFVGLEEEEEKLPEELSGGMRRRLEIARALMGWPTVMLFDEPTTMLDPIVAVRVLDVIIRTRDVNRSSSILVTKKLNEIPYLASHTASKDANGEVVIRQAPPGQLPKTKVILLDSGKIVFAGSVSDFQQSDSPLIRELLALDPHDHSADPYFPDPWEKRRRPKEEIL